MIALLSALIGFAGSFVPELLKVYKDKKDKEHEIKLLTLQMQREEKGFRYKLEEIGIQADIESEKIARAPETSVAIQTGYKLLDGIAAFYGSSVRPTITYAFFIQYAVVKWATYSFLVKHSVGKAEAIMQLWTAEDMAIFCAIMGYWFGQRAIQRYLGKK